MPEELTGYFKEQAERRDMVAQLARWGRTVRQIARDVNVSKSTVVSDLKAIRKRNEIG